MSRNIKRILIYGIAAIFIAIAITAIVISRAVENVVPILMYHSIDHNDKNTKLSVSPESFARHMEFLHKNHYNIITLEEAATYLNTGKKVPARTIAITFDDGFHNNYQDAYPILKKYRTPATIFVIVNRVGAPGFLTWDEIREMSDSGIITIGSHSRTHFWLLGSDPKFLEDEVANSKKILEDKIGKKVDVFCYPMGAFDADSKRAVQNAGYACAVATSPRGVKIDDIFAIKRVKISRSADNIFSFWAQTTKLYTWFKVRRDAE